MTKSFVDIFSFRYGTVNERCGKRWEKVRDDPKKDIDWKGNRYEQNANVSRTITAIFSILLKF